MRDIILIADDEQGGAILHALSSHLDHVRLLDPKPQPQKKDDMLRSLLAMAGMPSITERMPSRPQKYNQRKMRMRARRLGKTVREIRGTTR